MDETMIRPRDAVVAWLTARVRSWQRDLSNRAHAAGDERAQLQGWEVIGSTGRFGFGTRTYRDPRFNHRVESVSKERLAPHALSYGVGRDNGVEQ